MPLRSFFPLLLLGLALACACGSPDTPDNPASGAEPSPQTATFDGEYPIRVVTTTGMIADLAREIGGERVRVEALMGPGVDPHLYKASTDDVSRLRGADLILYNGLHLEGKMADVLERLSKRQPTFAVADQLPAEKLRTPPEFQGLHDPHVWFDVALWARVGGRVADLLAEFDPANAAEYAARAKEYLDRLNALDAWVRDRIATIPEPQRVMITAHDAFGYFGAAYDVEVMGIQGLSTESEAGVRRVNELVDLLVAREVKAVFIESSVSDKNIRALVEGSAARGHAVRIGGQLYSDAMGPAGSGADHYEGMIRHNVETIVGALR
ncbi:MAG TPA: zinc ABC transporter substrate-binding protein [Candidatus Sumerlaeota bacterium]|nr:zinc ABC transporter substrate-binding protein [Candidatus Sumerlaeota bacterium]HOR28317.1 zinc ABC transporter substrate-binding protein [Candidatus Sumerlaeota bacterium]HPK01937.1 zinc ABC transporter substrate-binding protein [Candidatus Sumerlaeota bacterium]